MKVSDIIKAGVLLCAALGVCLLVLEGATRVYSALFFPRMMVLDDHLGWRHATNVQKRFVNEWGEHALVTQNRYGHRGKEYPPRRVAGIQRVLVLGDSFVEAVQVGEEALFSTLMEELDPRLQVLNAGVGGYGTVQEYLYLEGEGVQFSPDLVLLLVYENDLTDNCLSYYPGFGPRPYAEMKGDELHIIESPDPTEFEKFTLPVPLSVFLNKHSYFFYFLNANIYHKLFSERMKRLQQLDLRKTDNCGKFQVFYAIISKMQQLLAQRGSTLALVLVPTRENVARGYSEALHAIREFCRDQHLLCLSLLDRFKMERSAQLYFPIDIHWTRAGHRVVADEINSFLSRTFTRTQQMHETSELTYPQTGPRRG